MSAPSGGEVDVHDLVGVGFGPSNLALAVAVSEHNARVGTSGAVRARFVERQREFGWHRGMLIDDATMQVSFLKDLVTLRNPASDFSFLSYLHQRDRLVDFINHKTLFPLRVEFHDYLRWAADRVSPVVDYGHEVVAVEPAAEGTCVDVVVRAAGSAAPVRHRTRNLVIGTGLVPRLPDGVVRTDRVWHTSELLPRIAERAGTAPSRFVVVGAGQSAAEAVAHLHREFPRAEVCAVFSRYGYSPADDSAFANRIFDPEAVGLFHAAPEEVKEMLLRYHGNTNYSVVDTDLIDDLYRRVYREKVLGTARLRLFNVARLAEVVDTGSRVRVTVESSATGATTVLDADALVCSTGYRPMDPGRLLGPAARHCHRDDAGRLVVERDYRVRTGPGLRCGIYLQGGTEHSHGITSSLLSNTAVRVGEILRSLLDRRPARRPYAMAGE
ncbi:L-lysine 6-monooxygenase [Wenjunlia vitaminophila]|uniref:L-lysine N6-monooxygenase MbtG n=1 Tax=Wenjunlia vitaminophila TaxID=76728 RepID=A0A0T6LWU4_WENVI|nr:lysine N(6)-hydroxylase/L-ornithine N(5)-oxygenase family protein [Wenjunlia vitaminophila]KRV50465.1 L-lysine 6-monooxygenase [Wenjunlia vitaminophila]